jgi:hypothetical protein
VNVGVSRAGGSPVSLEASIHTPDAKSVNGTARDLALAESVGA